MKSVFTSSLLFLAADATQTKVRTQVSVQTAAEKCLRVPVVKSGPVSHIEVEALNRHFTRATDFANWNWLLLDQIAMLQGNPMKANNPWSVNSMYKGISLPVHRIKATLGNWEDHIDQLTKQGLDDIHDDAQTMLEAYTKMVDNVRSVLSGDEDQDDAFNNKIVKISEKIHERLLDWMKVVDEFATRTHDYN